LHPEKLGVYPETSLGEVREKLLQARKLPSESVDLSQDKKKTKGADKRKLGKSTFVVIAREG
tara:strand:- start:1004 stop:1189 length:186 start_codon:yes stop_codon:yes gene_type:complete